MTREELKQQLVGIGFRKERFSEYNNDAFKNEAYVYNDNMLFLEVFVDYYNVRIVWWHQRGRKVAKNYYVSKDLTDYKSAEELIESFIGGMMKTYGIAL